MRADERALLIELSRTNAGITQDVDVQAVAGVLGIEPSRLYYILSHPWQNRGWYTYEEGSPYEGRLTEAGRAYGLRLAAEPDLDLPDPDDQADHLIDPDTVPRVYPEPTLTEDAPRT